jgi:thiol-disulfide isomerase/thioredoxin
MVIAFVSSSAPALAQAPARDGKGPSAPQAADASKGGASLQAIDDDYNKRLLELDRGRLEQLGRLADGQSPTEAAATYERLFRLAVAGDLFRDAEPAAARVLERGTPSTTTNALAHLVKIIAEADRGAYEQSLGSLRKALDESVRGRQANAPRASLDLDEIVAICEGYYQRLVEGGQFPIASQAFRLVLEQPHRPAVKEFLAARSKRIELVGKAAPPIRGTDLDGKPFDLADKKGKVVLVIFWATWCVPSAAQLEWLEKAQADHRERGLEVVGIDVDTQQDASLRPDTVLPNVRRYLLDNNVTWPTLLNGPGERDYASAYGVADIPANVLIGRDGTVVQIDLSRR